MKNVQLLLFFFLIYSRAANAQNTEVPKDIIIAGKILNHYKYPDKKIVNIYVNAPEKAMQLTYSDSIDAKGNFKIKFQRYLPQDVMIDYQINCQILVHPGDSMYIELDAEDKRRPAIYSHIQFYGDGAEQNIQLAAYLKDYFTYRYKIDSIDDAEKNMQENEYKAYQKSIRNDMLKERQNFLDKYKPDDEIRTWTLMNVEMDYYNNLLLYPLQHKHLNKLSPTWDVSADYYNFITSLADFNKSNLINTEASFFLPNYLAGHITSTALLENRNPAAALVNQLRFNKLLLQLALSQRCNSTLASYITDFYDQNKQAIEKYITEPYLKEPLMAHYKEVKEAINNPKVTSDAILKNFKNTKNQALFDSILNNYKNKVIYLDIWATWCGPCLSEMPRSKELYDKLKGKDIVFIYLCIDSDLNTWKPTLTKHKLTGIQFFLNKEQSAFLKNELKVNGIPHYVLFDKSGTIIESGSHLRPSNNQTLEKINKLL